MQRKVSRRLTLDRATSNGNSIAARTNKESADAVMTEMAV